MNNLLTYIPEPFENLEFESEVFEYEPLAGEMDMELEENEARRRRRSGRAISRRRSHGYSSSSRRPRFSRHSRQQHRSQLPAAGSQGSAGAAASGGYVAAPPVNNSLWQGQEGSERVRWAQDCLNRILDLRLIVDGIMNRETRSALREFQRRNGLPVTGFMGPDTEEALRSACQQAAAEPELLEGEWEMPHSASCSCSSCGGEGELAFEIEPFMDELEAVWKKVEDTFENFKCPACDGGHWKLHPRNYSTVDAECQNEKCGYEIQIKSIDRTGKGLSKKFPNDIKRLHGGSYRALSSYSTRVMENKKKKNGNKEYPPPLAIVLYDKNNNNATLFYCKTSKEMIEKTYDYKMTNNRNPKFVCNFPIIKEDNDTYSFMGLRRRRNCQLRIAYDYFKKINNELPVTLK